MTLSLVDIALYALAIGILFATPGPVWVAIIARTLSGGFKSSWPLAVGVAIGDIVWPLVAVLGVTWIIGVFDQFMIILRYVAVGMFLFMGLSLIKNAGREITTNTRLTRPGKWAGFLAGVAVILSNPKAVLFYIGILPNVFDLTRVTPLDIAAIVAASAVVPLVGNLLFALFVDRMRRFLTSSTALRNTNIAAGGLLIIVALMIAIL
ncbi:MAG: LysE family translocator [Rhodobacterales bacterium]|nr:LysE family translocator [Rhodobacterales bacterium]